MHEDFQIKGNAVPNDIALVRLATPVTFGIRAKPVCLPINPEKVAEFTFEEFDITNISSLIGKRAIVIGWGRTKPFEIGTLLVNTQIKKQFTVFKLIDILV